MPPFIADFLSQIKAIWARLDAGQRLTIGVVVTATLVGMGAIIWFAGLPDYQTVFTSAEPRLVQRAAGALDQGGVAYKFEGDSLSVESNSVDAARRALAAAGVNSGSSSGEQGELAAMTSDRATRMAALSRQMERETERKMMAIRGVLYAHVSHSKPKRSPYKALDHETQPRANVGLQLMPGASFGTIANVAVREAAAALGMPPEYITVSNLNNGQVYGETEDGAGSLDTMQFLEQQYRRSEELTSRAQTLLDRIYPDKALVRVTVVLDPKWQMLRERSAPDKQLIKRTVTTKENSADASPAVASDASGNPAIGTAATPGSTMKKESKETEYSGEGFKETSSGRLAPDIQQMTVALVVDEEIAPDSAAEQQLEALVKNAIGWSDDWGGDRAFTIHKAAIPELTFPSEPALPGLMTHVERWGPTVGQIIAVVLVLLFLRRLLKRSVPATSSAGSTASSSSSSSSSASPVARSRGGKAAPAGDKSEPVEQILSPEDEVRHMRREIERAIAEDPATITRMLESWLMETAK